MALRNVKDFGLAFDGGPFSSFRKVPSQASAAGLWVDLSFAGGHPVPNYYASAPLVAQTLDRWRGIFHGDDADGYDKHLADLCLVSPSAAFVGPFYLLDYLLYYPFVDLDLAEEQVMDNAITLSRYTNGEGVSAMAVAVTPTAGSGQFAFRYVNQDGVERDSPVQLCGTTAASISNLVTSQPGSVAGHGPFLRLADGDTGIRSIVSVTPTVLNGGLIAIVLVKKITYAVIREINTPVEVSFVRRRPLAPKIEAGAFLNFICETPASVAAAVLAGYTQFARSAAA